MPPTRACRPVLAENSPLDCFPGQSHLRFGMNEIHSPYLVQASDFVACHNPSYVHKYDMVENLKDGGIFLLNRGWTPEELDRELPASMKRKLAAKHAQFYTIDAIKIAREIGLGNRTNSVLQASFFKLSDVIPIEQAVEETIVQIRYTTRSH